MSYTDLIHNMTWSFSRLRTYETCPYAFYCHYIEGRGKDDNFYAANGSLMHEIFKMLLNKEITLEEAANYYIDNFDDSFEVKQTSMTSTFNKCLDYLCNVEPFDDTRYEILAVEKKLDFKIKGRKFLGIVDCLLKDKTNGEIILVDHKSSDHFLKKDGKTPLKSQEDNFFSYKLQMYLYCDAIIQKMKIQPDKICWHHFKDNGALTIIDYNETHRLTAEIWAINLIRKIEKDQVFEQNKSYMNCAQLCDFRYSCEYRFDEEEEVTD